MGATCGCGNDEGTRVSTMHAHPHDHPHAHDHPHPHQAAPTRTQTVELDILARNDSLAAANREWLVERAITALNQMSSPGSGKTTLLVPGGVQGNPSGLV